MSLIVAHLDENRMRRIRKDCIRDIVPIDGMPNCYNLVRDNTYSGEGDYWNDEPLTYKQGFSLDTIYKYMDFDGFIKTLKTGFCSKNLHIGRIHMKKDSTTPIILMLTNSILLNHFIHAVLQRVKSLKQVGFNMQEIRALAQGLFGFV